jgi:hypothetical protein
MEAVKLNGNGGWDAVCAPTMSPRTVFGLVSYSVISAFAGSFAPSIRDGVCELFKSEVFLIGKHFHPS